MQAKLQPSSENSTQTEKQIPVNFANPRRQPKLVPMKSAGAMAARKSFLADLDLSNRGVPISPLND
jgi:hypothetical protein